MTENDRKRLDTWKDIAQHLGHDVSTVRRWEKERGLPVHRLPGASRSAVFAYAEEIDAWILGQADEEASAASEKTPRKLLPLVVAGGLALVLGFAGLFAWRTTHRPHLAEARFEGQRLIAEDPSRRVLWTHDFSAPLDIPEGQRSRRVHVADLDGDGRREVVVGVRFSGSEVEEVFCFSDTGTLRWRYRPADALQFGRETFSGPWRIGDMLVEPGAAAKHTIWVAFTHHTWWPSFVVRIDETGEADLRFVSAGWVTELELFRNGSESYIVAAGLNNEYDAGALAIIDPTRQAARSPQTPGSLYACLDCPAARPHRYFVFPRSELNAVTGSPANIVRAIRALPDKLEVRTEEVNETSVQSFGVYELRGDFSLAAASMTDLYWDLHRRLEKEGKLSHGADVCRRHQPMKDLVRVWRGDGAEQAGLR